MSNLERLLWERRIWFWHQLRFQRTHLIVYSISSSSIGHRTFETDWCAVAIVYNILYLTLCIWYMCIRTSGLRWWNSELEVTRINSTLHIFIYNTWMVRARHNTQHKYCPCARPHWYHTPETRVPGNTKRSLLFGSFTMTTNADGWNACGYPIRSRM